VEYQHNIASRRFESADMGYVIEIASEARARGFECDWERSGDQNRWYVEVFAISRSEMSDLLRRAATFNHQLRR
jgi:hypothetical protein